MSLSDFTLIATITVLVIWLLMKRQKYTEHTEREKRNTSRNGEDLRAAKNIKKLDKRIFRKACLIIPSTHDFIEKYQKQIMLSTKAREIEGVIKLLLKDAKEYIKQGNNDDLEIAILMVEFLLVEIFRILLKNPLSEYQNTEGI